MPRFSHRARRSGSALALALLPVAQTAWASDIVVFADGGRRAGTLQSCAADQCRFDGRTLLRGEIAWIGLGSDMGEPPVPVNPDHDEIFLADGSVLPGPILGVSLGEVATESESHARDAVRWIRFAPGAPSVWIPPACRDLTSAAVAGLASPRTGQLGPERPLAPAEQLELFDQLAGVIEAHYVDPRFNGRDWPALVAARRAKLGGEVETEEFYALVKDLVTSLGDEHSKFETPNEIVAAAAALAGARRFVGVGMLLQPLPEKGRGTVILVYPGSSAERGGLRPHDSVLAANGEPVIAGEELDRSLLLGFECSRVTLTVQSPGAPPRDVELVRQAVAAAMPVPARLLEATDGSRVGYIFLPTFYDQPLVEAVRQTLRQWGDLDGLILDNRMNGGGSSTVVGPVLGFFTHGIVGHFVSREARRPLTISAEAIHNSQSVPLVVLVGKRTVSFGEIFAGALRDVGRARVVGSASNGNVETLHGYDLAGGSRVWIAQETFDPAVSHADWEEEGIRPDVVADADWDTITFESDPAVAAALILLGRR